MDDSPTSVPPPVMLPLSIGDDGVLLVGGSFDPPHIAHVELVARARDAVMPGAPAVFVPASRSPHKATGPAASDSDRAAMLGLAIAGVPRAGVWRDELERAVGGGPSYWVDTLSRARALVGDAPIRFVIGADQALALHRWRDAGRILMLAQPVVLLREPHGTVEALGESLRETGAWSDAQVAQLCALTADVGTIDVSATELRMLLRDDRKNARLEPMLAPGVLEFILDRGLYAADGLSADE